jgi:hypothetical protein
MDDKNMIKKIEIYTNEQINKIIEEKLLKQIAKSIFRSKFQNKVDTNTY